MGAFSPREDVLVESGVGYSVGNVSGWVSPAACEMTDSSALTASVPLGPASRQKPNPGAQRRDGSAPVHLGERPAGPGFPLSPSASPSPRVTHPLPLQPVLLVVACDCSYCVTAHSSKRQLRVSQGRVKGEEGGVGHGEAHSVQECSLFFWECHLFMLLAGSVVSEAKHSQDSHCLGLYRKRLALPTWNAFLGEP